MSNRFLNDLSGISGKSSIAVLALQNCGLTNIKTTGDDDLEYISGGLTYLSENTGLTKLSVHHNSGLTSLKGLEKLTNLANIVANNCNINDISSLANISFDAAGKQIIAPSHSALTYLNLRDNGTYDSNNVFISSLVEVDALGGLIGLNSINLLGDENIDWDDGSNEEEERDYFKGIGKLNSTYVRDGVTYRIIANCGGLDGLPQKYWEIFENNVNVLNYSYGQIKTYLEDDSQKIQLLSGRTDLKRLDLGGQSHLTSAGINSILSSLTGLEYLNLEGCTLLNSDSFAASMPSLKGISLYGTNIIDVVNIATYCSRITSIALSEKMVSGSSAYSLTRLWNSGGDNSVLYSYFKVARYGLNVHGDSVFQELINNYTGKNFYYNSGANLGADGDLDFSGTNIEEFTTACSRVCGGSILLPNCIKNAKMHYPPECYFTFENGSNPESVNFDFGTISYDSLIRRINGLKTADSIGSVSISTVAKETLTNSTITSNNNSLSFSGVKTTKLSLRSDKRYMGQTAISTNIILDDCTTSFTGIGLNLNVLPTTNYPSRITELVLNNNMFSNISGLSNYTGLTKLELDNNNISDISPLTQAITYGENDDNQFGTIGYTSLKIANNGLGSENGPSNVNALLKLHAAGLVSVDISGNGFYAADITDLINGKKIDNTDYPGFGEENVTNLN